MYATKTTYVRQPSPMCIVCNRAIYKENERYRLYKLGERRQGYSDGEMTMMGTLLNKVATDTKTLSIVEARHLSHICNICRNALVKVQRAQKHLDDAYKDYCSRLQGPQSQATSEVHHIQPTSLIAHETGPIGSAANLPATLSSKHARPLFLPSGVSPAAKRPTLRSKATLNVPSPLRTVSTSHLRDSAGCPTAARSLIFSDASSSRLPQLVIPAPTVFLLKKYIQFVCILI